MITQIRQSITSEIICPSTGGKAIFFGVDGSFIRHAMITMQSVINHSERFVFHFHILSSELSEEDCSAYRNIAETGGCGLTLHKISPELFSDLPTTDLFSKATYYRLLAPKLIEEDRLLYLDADIVCLAPCDELWSHPLTDEVAYVISESPELAPVLAEKAGLKGSRYFNAGVMLINKQRWNELNISEAVFDLLLKKGKSFKYLDQDALNIILEGYIDFGERRFNTIFMLKHDEQGYCALPPAETVFLHYAGADKPWQQWNEQAVCRFYWEIYNKSHLAKIPFDLPEKDWQAKKFYKLLLRNRKFIPGIRWLINYYKMRYIKL
ncbi:lipopolysaccharide 1,3-galactosyltransferase [Enterobacteriaceae bacterium H20N1]|uniref:Lipopolysaccharide 1,3-galactosyltransferase n=1 Tax=Dryocola boscaweniae TaxID=2925397 RepID=A0A9X2W8M4_9ENTR|nr:glycosyltransferase family 8 protein [Dryocola boscaweniae]MCT4702999.1 lipopolysaccharide 1,3-galactosyltransferase [Dryocola boscaweniae]MCT4720167.1 lipopolysaccharide 1,3-galactosyltransferase [Dryocola boscaweniae]